MNNDFNVSKAIVGFYNDENFQRVKQYYERTTIFNVLKIERNENRHSAFICWLLDIKGSHNLGEEPLRKFLRSVSDGVNNPIVRNHLVVGNYKIEDYDICTEQQAESDGKSGRIDIYIRFTMAWDNERVFVQVLIENKIYTAEHDNQTETYRKWAEKQKRDGCMDSQIIGVFISPDEVVHCDGDCDGFKYEKLTYEDLLNDVIEPMSGVEMATEARQVISDYIVNLGQPSCADDNSGATIIAIQKNCKKWLESIYNANKRLLDTAIYIGNTDDKKTKELKEWVGIVGCDVIEAIKDDEKEMLKGFWIENIKYMRLTFDEYCERLGDDDNQKKIKETIGTLLEMKKSNRDNTKYVVYGEDGKPLNQNGFPKSKASFLIFKAWLVRNNGATLEDLRNAFPVEKIVKEYYGKTYQYLFYKKKDIEKAIKDGENGHDYVVAPMDEDEEDTKKARKYIKWDFFQGKDAEKYALNVDNEEVLSIKMWHKKEFDSLKEFAAEKYGIKVVDK